MKSFYAWEFSLLTSWSLSLGDINQFLQLLLLLWGLYSAYRATKAIRNKDKNKPE